MRSHTKKVAQLKLFLHPCKIVSGGGLLAGPKAAPLTEEESLTGVACYSVKKGHVV